jgi:hypothetical protein
MAVDYGDPPVEEAVRAARASSRRRQVLDAAVTVMGKNGFHQMSMQDLAAEAKLLAHAWALKHWYFGPVYTVDKYLALQIRRVLVSLVADERRADYAHLLG